MSSNAVLDPQAPSNLHDFSITQEMVFEDLPPVEVPVTIGSRKFILCEASSGAAVLYRTAILRGAQMEGDKVSGVSGIAEAEPLLVSMCLFELKTRVLKGGGEEEQRVPMPLAEIKKWSAQRVKALFERAQKISGLSETETEESLEKLLTEVTRKLEALRVRREQGKEQDDPVKP